MLFCFVGLLHPLREGLGMGFSFGSCHQTWEASHPHHLRESAEVLLCPLEGVSIMHVDEEAIPPFFCV